MTVRDPIEDCDDFLSRGLSPDELRRENYLEKFKSKGYKKHPFYRGYMHPEYSKREGLTFKRRNVAAYIDKMPPELRIFYVQNHAILTRAVKILYENRVGYEKAWCVLMYLLCLDKDLWMTFRDKIAETFLDERYLDHECEDLHIARLTFSREDVDFRSLPHPPAGSGGPIVRGLRRKVTAHKISTPESGDDGEQNP